MYRISWLSPSQALGCTGGGAFKFEESFLQRLGVRMLQMDEMECLVRGMQFALANIPEACYTYRPPVEVEEAVPPPPMAGGEGQGEGEGGDEPGPDPRDNLRNKRMREMAEVSAKRVSELVRERSTIVMIPTHVIFQGAVVIASCLYCCSVT